MGWYEEAKVEAIVMPQILKTYKKSAYVELTERNPVIEFFANVTKHR